MSILPLLQVDSVCHYSPSSSNLPPSLVFYLAGGVRPHERAPASPPPPLPSSLAPRHRRRLLAPPPASRCQTCAGRPPWTRRRQSRARVPLFPLLLFHHCPLLLLAPPLERAGRRSSEPGAALAGHGGAGLGAELGERWPPPSGKQGPGPPSLPPSLSPAPAARTRRGGARAT